MRYVLLMVIVVGAVMWPRVVIARKVDNAMLKRVGEAISTAVPLLHSKRLNLLRASTVINDILLKQETATADNKLMLPSRDKLLDEIRTPVSWPADAMLAVPRYMNDLSGLRYDVIEYPLHVAVVRGNYSEAVKLLEKDKVDVNAVDRRGFTPLHLAADLGNVLMTALLVRNGAKINSKVKQAWHYEDLKASSKKQRKKKVDNSDVRGMTAMHLAVKNEHLDVLTLLVLEKAKLDVAQREAATPVHLAAAKDFTEALLVFDWAGIDFNLNVDGRTPLDDALQHEKTDAIDFLTQPDAKRTRKKYLNRALLRVLNINQLQLLLEHKASFADSSNDAVIGYAQRSDDSLAALLIKHVINELDGDPDAVDEDGTYALQFALDGGNEATVKALLEGGADPLARKNGKGKTHFERARKVGLAHLFIPYLKDRTNLPQDVAKILAREEVLNSSGNQQ